MVYFLAPPVLIQLDFLWFIFYILQENKDLSTPATIISWIRP